MLRGVRLTFAPLLLLGLAGHAQSAPVATVSAAASPTLALSQLPEPGKLADLLWQHSPDLLAARARLAQAKGDVDRSYLVPNPTLDFSWNAVPVGRTNPVALEDPLNRIPNYGFALSELVELGKRGPRQRSTENARTSALLDVAELLRQRYFDFLERSSEVATAELRVAALDDTAVDAARLTVIQKQRLDKGDAAGLDVDRSVLEEEKIQSNLGEEKEKLEAALMACSQVLGMRCAGFGDRVAAAQFLGQRLAPTSRPPLPLDERPDLRSLKAQEASARAAEDLGYAHGIPDPTFRVGYVWDQFVISGNQTHSLYVGVSLPLPVFDHGQADAHQAAALAAGALAQHDLLEHQAAADLGALDGQILQALTRRQRLKDHTLPLAKEVVQRLDEAVKRGSAPLPDLLLARRTLYELLLDAADLDQFTYHLSVTRSRTAGELPPLVADLSRGHR